MLASASRTVRWVIPAYNEVASITDLIDRIASVSEGAGWAWTLTVVDDGSSDGTGGVAVNHATQLELPIGVVRNEPNQGLGRTIRRGLQVAAQASGSDDVIVTLDADLTQDPVYAISMIEAIDEGADVVIASRYRKGSGVEGLSLFRSLLSYVASGLVSLIRPIRGVRDYSCGFRVYRASIIQLGFDLYGDDFVGERGFACMLEIAERLQEVAIFKEVPFVLRYQDKRKASEIRIARTIGAYFRVIAKVASGRRRPINPTTLALALLSVGLAAGAQICLRMGAQDLGGLSVLATLAEALSRPLVIVGLATYALSSALWLAILSRVELSVAYPLGSLGYVVVVVMAAVTGEVVPLNRWLGVGLIAIGVLLIGWLGMVPKVGERK